MSWFIHHVFLLVAPWVWCMNFYEMFYLKWFCKWLQPFFKVCEHIFWSHVPLLILHFLSTFQLLALKKWFECICPILIDEVTYRLIVCTLVIQFKNILVKHFSLHQFSVMTHDRCEIMVHGNWMMLDLDPNWVVLWMDVHNAFNLMSWSAIFQELQFSLGSLDQISPFVRQFYAHPSPLYIS